MVVNLIDRITARMRAAGRTGRTVALRLRFDDFSRATRSHTLPWATSSTQPILVAARQLVASAAPADRAARTDAGRVRGVRDRPQRRPAADAAVQRGAAGRRRRAVDQVRRRYGKSALTRAVLVGRDPGLEMPHLPD